MPHSNSAKKRYRQSETRNDRNRQKRSAVRSAIKKVQTAESPEQAEAAYKEAESLLDRAAGKRLFHPNAVARTKSRLRKAIQRGSE